MSKLKAGHKARKQTTKSTASDPEWWPGILARLAKTHDFLTSRGYSTDDEEIEALSFWDREAPEAPPDGRAPEPPAEVVAAARAYRAAGCVAYAIANNVPEALPVVMFLLGEEYLRFQILRTTPGLSIEVIIRDDGLPSLFQFVSENAGKELTRRRKMGEGLKDHLEKRKEGLKPRNDVLCAVALTLRSEGVKDLHLATRTLRYFNWKNLWSNFPEEQRLTSSKQVLAILRDENILPPARKKKTRK